MDKKTKELLVKMAGQKQLLKATQEPTIPLVATTHLHSPNKTLEF